VALASTANETEAVEEGWTNGAAAASADLAARNAASNEEDHSRDLGEPARASVRGLRVPAIPGRKRR